MFYDTVNKSKLALRVNPCLVKKSSSCDERQIWLTATIDKKRVKIYSGLRIASQFWDRKNGRVFEDGSFSHIQKEKNKKINKELKKIVNYCQEFVNLASETDLQGHPIPFTADFFKKFLFNKIRGKEAVIQRDAEAFIIDYIERKKEAVNKRTRRTLSSGTIYNHWNALARLRRYCTKKHKKISWDLFTKNFETSFTAWMNECGYSANTIASQYSIMKVWLYEAEDDGLMENKSFHRYDTSTFNVDNVYLNEEEIKAYIT